MERIRGVSILKEVKGDKCKRRFLLSKMSEVMNVLPYYARVNECDNLMRQFSEGSERLWSKNFSTWLEYLDENMAKIIIHKNNIDYYSNNICANYCTLTFSASDMITKTCREKVLKFITNIPNKKQIREIIIRFKHLDLINFNSYQKVSKIVPIMNRVSEALGKKPSPYQTCKDGKYIYYFSDIFILQSTYSPYKPKLRVFPKVNNTSRIICVDSKFVLNDKQIVIHVKNFLCLPDVCYFKLEDPDIPIFEDVVEIELIINDQLCSPYENIRCITEKCYPNLQRIVCSPGLSYADSQHYILKTVENTNVMIKFKCCNEITKCSVKALNAKYICPEGGLDNCFQCDIEAGIDLFLINGGYLYASTLCFMSIDKVVKSKLTEEASKKFIQFNGLDSAAISLHLFKLLIIPLEEICCVSQSASSLKVVDPILPCPRSSYQNSLVFFHSFFSPTCTLKINNVASTINLQQRPIQKLAPFWSKVIVKVSLMCSYLGFHSPKEEGYGNLKQVDLEIYRKGFQFRRHQKMLC
ncbi:unnamed protein product [Moneuplotes crassus]|uniref:Uncharacterized protein n=1 Tax=Euplotes crassus TaxID=5936 RepID=A0AAD1U2T9_EUPCR|nr:unnamed protein product [Moneuplotes crassus]